MEEEILTPPIGPFFRFADKNAWLTAARAAGFTADFPVYDEEGNETGTEEKVVQYTHNYALDVIGTISRGGEWDEDGNVITEPTVLDGWHVNYVGELPAGWEQYAVTPEQPYRVFA
jgi:hypothetical protein